MKFVMSFFFYNNTKITRKKTINTTDIKAVSPEGTSGDIAMDAATEKK